MRIFRSAGLPVALTVALSAVLASNATAATPLSGAASYPGHISHTPASLLPAGHAWQVTLITGDVVRVRAVDGRPPLVAITPGPGRQHVMFGRYEDNQGHVLVIPQDMAPLIGRVLDPALFNITTLIQAGDDDAHRTALPLIIQAGAAGPAALPAALRAGQSLAHQRPAAVTEPRSAAARVGAWLSRMAAAVGARGAVPRATGNIGHVWLGGTAPAASRQDCSRPRLQTTYPLTVHATPLPGTASGKLSGLVLVLKISDLAFCEYPEVALNQKGTGTVQLPAGDYWLVGQVNDTTNAAAPRSELVGVPELTVHGAVTVTFDGAKAAPVTASVDGHPTIVAEDGILAERTNASLTAGWGIFNFVPSGHPLMFAEPTGTARTGTFHAYTSFNLTSPAGTRQPYTYSLWHPLGAQIPQSLAYRVTPAIRASLARVNVSFYALDGNRAQVRDIRYGMDTSGFLIGGVYLPAESDNQAPGGSTRTDYVSTQGIAWDQEAVPPFRVNGQNHQGDWVIEVPNFEQFKPGSTQSASWIREPFAPGPYSATVPTASECAPTASARTGNDVHVELTDLQDLRDGFDCLGFTGDMSGTTRTMLLYSGGKLIGRTSTAFSDFTVPAASTAFQLRYIDNTSSVLPVSTRTDTTWKFGARPGARLPLLLVSYDLPLNLDNHPDGSTAVLTVGRVAGVPRATVTTVRFWTSTDQGKTWQWGKVTRLAAGRYAVTLPHAASGQSVSLRVEATDAGGSGITQTIITAYHG